jgi:hypothetical protein
MKYEALVYLAFLSVVVVFLFGGRVILGTNDNVDFETRKLHFSAVTFTGITILFVFISFSISRAKKVAMANKSSVGDGIEFWPEKNDKRI